MVGRIDGAGLLGLSLQMEAHDFAESIPPIAHGQQFKVVQRPFGSPTGRHGVRRLLGRQRAFELVRNDENIERHVGNVHWEVLGQQQQFGLPNTKSPYDPFGPNDQCPSP